MNTSTQQPPIHLSILGIQFSLRFSSAFPNGWLNQLCGAWFKSSGMLAYCQRLVGQQGRNNVTGGEQSSPLLLASLKSSSIKMNLRLTEQIQFKKCFCLEKLFTKSLAFFQHIYTHTHTHTHRSKDTPSKLMKTYTLSYCKHTQKYQMANKITTTYAASQSEPWHGKPEKNIKVLWGLIIKKKCSTIPKSECFMVCLCFASPEKLSLNSIPAMFLSYIIIFVCTLCLELNVFSYTYKSNRKIVQQLLYVFLLI